MSLFYVLFLKGETIQGGTFRVVQIIQGGILIKEIRYLFFVKKRKKKSDRSQECERDVAGA